MYSRTTNTYTCDTCGKEFEGPSYFHECPDCYKKRKENERTQEETACAEKAAKIIQKYNLPKIVGVSQKQIQYARTLRNKVLSDINPTRIKLYANFHDACTDPNHPLRGELQKSADVHTHGDVEKWFDIVGCSQRYKYINALWREKSASEIIDICSAYLYGDYYQF